MRGTGIGTAELPTPHPLGSTLPAVYQDDSFTQRLCEALDQVLSPVISTLDCFPAYLDPATTPADMLDWLGSWVGIAMAADWPLPRRRALVARAASLHASRGTAAALREIVELTAGVTPEIVESGGVAWSPTPRTRLPGRATPGLVVRVAAAGSDLDERWLLRVIALVAPAHLPWRLELT